MALGVYGTVGLQGPIASGVVGVPFSQGNYGEILASEVLPRFAMLSKGSKLFAATGISTALVIFSTAAATGGPLLWNNSASTNAVLIGMSYAVTTASGVAGAIGIAVGSTTAPSSTTAIDSSSGGYVGGASTAMSLYRLGTVSTPATGFFALGAIHTGAVTVDVNTPTYVPIDGFWTIPPGKFAAVSASATLTSAVIQATLYWAELPV